MGGHRQSHHRSPRQKLSPGLGYHEPISGHPPTRASGRVPVPGTGHRAGAACKVVFRSPGRRPREAVDRHRVPWPDDAVADLLPDARRDAPLHALGSTPACGEFGSWTATRSPRPRLPSAETDTVIAQLGCALTERGNVEGRAGLPDPGAACSRFPNAADPSQGSGGGGTYPSLACPTKHRRRRMSARRRRIAARTRAKEASTRRGWLSTAVPVIRQEECGLEGRSRCGPRFVLVLGASAPDARPGDDWKIRAPAAAEAGAPRPTQPWRLRRVGGRR